MVQKPKKTHQIDEFFGLYAPFPMLDEKHKLIRIPKWITKWNQ